MFLGLDDEQHKLDAELDAELTMVSAAQHLCAEPAPHARAAPTDRAPPGSRARPDLRDGFYDVPGPGLSYACPVCGVHRHLSLKTLPEAFVLRKTYFTASYAIVLQYDMISISYRMPWYNLISISYS